MGGNEQTGDTVRRAATAVTTAALVAGAIAFGVGALDRATVDGAGGVAGPSVLTAPDGSVVAAGLEAAGSCEELGDTMRELAGRHGAGAGAPLEFVEDEAAAGDDAGRSIAPQDATATAESAAPGATGTAGDGTNVQVTGVDEPDLVERVGDLVVVGTQGTLRVVTLDGAGAPVVRGELVVGAWSEAELFAVGDDRAVAVVRDGAPVVRPLPATDVGSDEPVIRPSSSASSVVLVDLADPDAPRELSRVDLEGWLVDARAVDGVVRLAVRGDGPQVDVRLDERDVLPGFDRATATEVEWRAWEQAWSQAYAQRHAAALASVRPSHWQPHARTTTADGSSVVAPLVTCDRIAFPTSFAGLGTLTVATIDATGEALAVDDATSIVTSGEQLYATADRLVVATTRWEPCCDDLPAPEPEPSVDPFFDEGEDAPTGTDDEAATGRVGAMADVALPVEPGWWGRGNSTDLHVFDVDGTLVDHVASGNVDGWLLDQFSMSVHDGVLRVATTNVDEASSRTSSAVTTLRVEGDDLVRLGVVEGLGPDEDIQAVRFMGDVAHVVTFRRTDPLYVVDLSDPAAPRTLGELKIEGYSAHLHPLGPGRLLGVGQDADPETGITRGVQVSTFDVSDPTEPTRIDVDVVPGSHSEVEWDHHALTVTRAGTVLVPFESWSPTGDRARFGVLVYEVTADGSLVDVGVLDAGSRWELRPRRTVDLDEVLLTVGDQGVTTWDAATFRSLGQVVFPEPDPAAVERHMEQG